MVYVESFGQESRGKLLVALSIKRALLKLARHLRGRLGNRFLGWGGRLVLRSRGEILLLDFGRCRAATVLVDGILSLVRILSGIGLERLGSVSSMPSRQVPNLVRLLVRHVGGLPKVCIDHLLVLDVD